MRRSVVALDRLAALVAGLILLAAGAAALAWRQDWIPDAPDRIRSPWLTTATAADWWPWATGFGGLLLVVLGLSWLAKHLPRRGNGRLRLTGSDTSGRLTADVNAALTAAGELLAETPGIRSADGRVVLDRGRLVAELHPVLEPGADLDQVRAAAERTGRDLLQLVGRDDLSCRVKLRVARQDKTPVVPRVQ